MQPTDNKASTTEQGESQTNINELPDRLPDFGCEATDSFCQLLATFGLTLFATSYQSSRVFIVRSDGHSLNLNVKTFPRPMGLAVSEQQIILGIDSQLIDFRRFDPVAEVLEPAGKVSSCFVPRGSHVTGMINIHDIAWGKGGLWVVNSQFSCLAQLSSDYSFVPRWKPYFIDELVPEDRCHLNGMALKDGEPAFATCFHTVNSAAAWRDMPNDSGALLDVRANKILTQGLSLPHSPRYHQGMLYLCNSGRGEFCRVDPETGEMETLLQLPGFARGVDFYHNLAFIGTSNYRQSNSRPPLPLADVDTFCGITVVDLQDMSILGQFRFTGDVKQIYDVAVCPLPFSDLLQIDEPQIASIYDFPPL